VSEATKPRRADQRERWAGLQRRPDWPLLDVVVNEVKVLGEKEREGLDYAGVGQGWLNENVNVRVSFALSAEEVEDFLWTLLGGNTRHHRLQPELIQQVSHVHKPVGG
jgi:hypothetical protein